MAKATIEVDLDGYTDLPPGRIANIVTHLEMLEPPETSRRPSPPTPPHDVALVRLRGPELSRYRALFAAIGDPWLWFGRRTLSDDALTRILDDDRVEAYAVTRSGDDVGLLELDGRVEGDVELAYFGVIPAAIGSGLGRFMMDTALWHAWSATPRRVSVHTCTLDHPDALGFYRRAGFRPYKFSIEVAPDPRLTGLLPRTAAERVPLIDP